MLRIASGIILGVMGVALGVLLWFMSIQNASMATGPHAQAYASSAKWLYWAGVASGLVGVVAGVLLARSGSRGESDGPLGRD